MEGCVMARGVKWCEEWDAVLRERFPEEKNEDLARELGCGVRTLERHARALGLEKSVEFKDRAKEWAKSGALMWYEYMRITGQKVRRSGVCGRPFEKGHRLPPEVEARRVQAIRDRAWDERVRIMKGFTRKTGWKMVDYATGKKV